MIAIIGSQSKNNVAKFITIKIFTILHNDSSLPH
jgi:hypothetical protein